MENILKSIPLEQEVVKEKSTNTQQIIQEITLVKHQLTAIQQNFNMVEDEYAIESCIYQYNSLMARYNYLIKLAKQNNMKLHLGHTLLKV